MVARPEHQLVPVSTDPEWSSTPGRLKVFFPSREAYTAAQSMEVPGTNVVLQSVRRQFFVLEPPAAVIRHEPPEHVLDYSITQADVFRQEFDAQLIEDYQYNMDMDFSPFDIEALTTDASLDDVLAMIRADEAQMHGVSGKDTVIAVIDTGIDGTRNEFPLGKRYSSWAPPGDDAWTDWQGHGTMCACIAAGTTEFGGEFTGVAPDARLISCKTRFYDTELSVIFDFLSDLQEEHEDLTIIASNSFGIRAGTAPVTSPGSTFVDALTEAIENGVLVLCSAGNNHHLAGGRLSECHPNSIWLYKSHADIMTVATCDLQGDMWYYSSRGPGQWFGAENTNQKPDVTAPTPSNGLILYGSTSRSLQDGWGTSGACPQVAGLAALLLEKNPALDRATLFSAIRAGARGLGHGVECEGAGVIDCMVSLNVVSDGGLGGAPNV